MKIKEAKKRIEKLRKEIDFHRYNYHVLDQETISPAVLDNLKAELFYLENEFPQLITPDSPTQRVAGKPLKQFKKAPHLSPMISLFDAFSQEDMLAWQKRNENYLKSTWQKKYYCELKLDGLAISLRYQNRQLILALTRGDGKIGEDVTQNAKTIFSVPLSLPTLDRKKILALGINEQTAKLILTKIEKGLLEVRGEAIMTKAVFSNLNQKNKETKKALLANTRNAVAGSMRQLNPKITASRQLDFYAYDLIFTNTERGELIKSKEQLDKLLRLLGFKILADNRVCFDLNEVLAFYRQTEKKREKLPLEIDGIVVKVNDLKFWPILGVVGKAPRYMMAYKFSAEQAATKVIDIIWQVGRTGVLTPIAILEPVKVGGALISRSTLHNFDEINRLDLKLGDTVIIERSGDVIPKIISVIKNLRTGTEKKIKVPKKCPRCQGEIKRINDEVFYRCLNKNCLAVGLRRTAHFVSKGAADFAGLGPKLIKQFMTSGLIRNAADLYTLRKSDLLSLERFAEKKADNIISLIEEKKELDLARFIYALGILHVGEETANLLAEKLVIETKKKLIKKLNLEKEKSVLITIPEIINFFKNQEKEYFIQIPDIGEVVASSIYNFWREQRNIEFLQKLEKNGVLINILNTLKNLKKEDKDLKLVGKILVLTGTLPSLTRQEAKDKIKALGGKTKETVSKDVDYLIAGESPGSKYQKAKQLGIKILNEEEFLKII